MGYSVQDLKDDVSGAGSGTAGYVDARNPWSTTKGRKAREQSEAVAAEAYDETNKINKSLDKVDKAYLNRYGSTSGTYLENAKALKNDYNNQLSDLWHESRDQADNAQKTYSNTILPEMKNLMGNAKATASQAMSLEDASDPNNDVQRAVRDMYNQQGDRVRSRGQQDYGILSGLGAQAAEQRFGALGGTPMTSGLMGQIYAANQSQAGDAYARAQQRMYDLEQQGINRGFDQSNQIYQFGQQAQDRYGQAVGALQGSQDQFQDAQSKYRDELGGIQGDAYSNDMAYNSDVFNKQQLGSQLSRDAAYAGKGRKQAAYNALHGIEQQAIGNEAQANSANQAAMTQLLAAIITGGASYAASGATGGASGGSAAAASDKRAKHSIADISDKDLDQFLSKIKPKTYEYDEPETSGTDGGKRVGFMLQDVQGTKLGKAITRKDPSGKMYYDKDNLNNIVLAQLARNHKKSA